MPQSTTLKSRSGQLPTIHVAKPPSQMSDDELRELGLRERMLRRKTQSLFARTLRRTNQVGTEKRAAAQDR
jgi:hypothetical protein